MNETIYDKSQTRKYLIWTFSIAWVMQIGVALLYHNGLAIIGQLLMAVMMFAPLLGVLLSGRSLSGMGWKPHFRGKMKALLLAWFLPALLTAIGAAMYFAVFPGHFDVNGEYIAATGGAEALTLMDSQGISYFQYVLISIV
ncbi:MAG: CPBP family intramembrane metalloprotease, partial [Lachnospiraceae bacterium]|nr:CPBP family intramembrane metalloprotease [Lachnospiraceae bacterium]